MNAPITFALAALIAMPVGATDLESFKAKGAYDRCYENPTDPAHRRTLISFRAPIKDRFGFVHRIVEGWERNWTESGGEHPTLLYGIAVLFPINNGEYDLVQMRLTRTFPGSDIDGDTWYFDDYQGHIGGYHYEVDCDAPWPLAADATQSATQSTQSVTQSASSARKAARSGFGLIAE